jgi:tRNA(Ile)-lysidine synthase
VILNAVLHTLHARGLLRGGETVVVGVSGGPDSMALLHVLWRLRERLSFGLHVCHVNHRLRGEQADAEAAAVEAFACQLGAPATAVVRDVAARATAEGISVEEAGRRTRYEAFEETAQTIAATKVAVGHTADDQVETILLNLLRGAGPEGLAGMPPARGKIIRPLIDVRREQTIAYCRQHGLPYHLDPSNLDRRFLRNRVRLDLVPQLRDLREGAEAGLLRFAEVARVEEGFFRERTEEAFSQVATRASSEAVAFGLAGFAEQHLALQRRLVREAVRRLRGDLSGLELAHVDAAISLIEAEPGKQVELGADLVAVRTYSEIVLAGAPAEPPLPFAGEVSLTLPGVTAIPELGLRIEAALGVGEADGRDVVVLDADRLISPVIRARRPGDRFFPAGAPGEKKLQDFFVNEKIPRPERGRQPLLAAGERQVAWVIGRRVGEPFRAGPETTHPVTLLAVWGSKMEQDR